MLGEERNGLIQNALQHLSVGNCQVQLAEKK